MILWSHRNKYNGKNKNLNKQEVKTDFFKCVDVVLLAITSIRFLSAQELQCKSHSPG